MLYPLKLRGQNVEKVWGGKRLINTANQSAESVGERWDVTDHPTMESQVLNGKFRGRSFQDLLRENLTEMLGAKQGAEGLPLMLKFLEIDQGHLSVQVHPDDTTAQALGYARGKDEIWYILHAGAGSRMIAGYKEMDTVSLDNTDLNQFNEVPLYAGDVIYIPAGLVHALEGEIFLIEVQQNSDATFRIYDFDQNRELHLDQAARSLKKYGVPPKRNGVGIEEGIFKRNILMASKSFLLEEVLFRGSGIWPKRKAAFEILVCLEGHCTFQSDTFSVELQPYDVVFIPAGIGDMETRGHSKLLRSFVPDLEQLHLEILDRIS